jgi:hypothetical protein
MTITFVLDIHSVGRITMAIIMDVVILIQILRIFIHPPAFLVVMGLALAHAGLLAMILIMIIIIAALIIAGAVADIQPNISIKIVIPIVVNAVQLEMVIASSAIHPTFCG